MAAEQNARAPDGQDGLPEPRRKWAALTVLIGISLSVLDASMANVALPALARELGSSASSVVWIVNAYGLTVAMTLLPFSSIGERIGFKTLFRLGLLVFIVASVCCALAPSLQWLLIFRVFQGLGSSAIMCLFGGLVRHIYPLSSMSRGIGLNAMTVGVMSVLGPTIGSFILSVASWHWIFALNVPIGILAYWGTKYLPDVPRVESRFDHLAAVLSMFTVGTLIVGIDYVSTFPLQAIGIVALGAVAGIVLVRRSSQQTAPLVPVDLFRIPPIRFALGASASTFAAQMATFISLPFYLQQTLDKSQSAVGFLMASWPAGAALIALIAGRLANRYPVAILSGLGAGAMATGLALIVVLPAAVSDVWLMLAMMLAGIGFGFFQTPNNRVMIGSAPRNRAGAVGGLQATTRVLGQTFGGAVVASLFALGLDAGPTLGLIAAILFALVAVAVNVIRHRQTSSAQEG
jgi:DHA2 family multidrug resistance protein-like MFS transporter